MITTFVNVFGRVLFRPLAWLGWAAFLVVLFGICHLLGWRDETSILSGTLAPGGSDATIVRGLLYLATYFAATLISPILVLAAGIYALCDNRLLAYQNKAAGRP